MVSARATPSGVLYAVRCSAGGTPRGPSASPTPPEQSSPPAWRAPTTCRPRERWKNFWRGLPMPRAVKRLTEIRATRPEAVAEALAGRRRRPLLGEAGTLFLLAADHPARGVVKVGEIHMAMADRGDFLERIVAALERPGVDGLMASPDIVDDLALLGALDEKVVVGSMNRGGLSGAVFELDDRFTGYTPQAIADANLDGGKMLLRIADEDRDTLPTITACADAVDALAARGLMAMIEPFASRRVAGEGKNVLEPDPTIRAIGVSSP